MEVFNSFQTCGHDSVPSVFQVINQIRQTGMVHQSRLGPTIEVMNASIRFPMDHAPYRPLMARKLGIVEALQFLSGYFDPRHSKSVAPKARYPFIVTHAYGLKAANQLPGIIDQLKSKAGTRRAILHIGQTGDGFEVEKPCIQSYQFMIRNGQLFMTVWARSWDAISGLPYDVTVANIVGQVISQLVGVEAAWTTFMTTSLHYYISDFDRLVGAVGSGINSPPRWTRIVVDRKFDSIEDVRLWAIDQLNWLDCWSTHGWSTHGGLPRGLMSD